MMPIFACIAELRCWHRRCLCAFGRFLILDSWAATWSLRESAACECPASPALPFLHAHMRICALARAVRTRADDERADNEEPLMPPTVEMTPYELIVELYKVR